MDGVGEGEDAEDPVEAADPEVDSLDELRLKPKLCIRREISFEARSTTEGVLMLISNRTKVQVQH